MKTQMRAHSRQIQREDLGIGWLAGGCSYPMEGEKRFPLAAGGDRPSARHNCLCACFTAT